MSAPAPRPNRSTPSPARLLLPGLLGLLVATGIIGVMDASAVPFQIPVTQDSDDGLEIDDAVWDPDPAALSFGRMADDSVHDVALRFLVPELAALQEVAFARLRFYSLGSTIPDSLVFTISAVAELAPGCPSQERRPSMLFHTAQRVVCTIRQPWIDSGANPVFYYSPDIGGVINELLALPGWPGDSATLVLCLQDSSAACAGPAFVSCSDFDDARAPVTLEICRDLCEAFDCHALAGRPTDHSVTINYRPLVDIEACIEYGTGSDWHATPAQLVGGGEACEVVLQGLEAGTAYTYRLRFRRAGTGDEFESGADGGFHTQRSPEEPFTFTAQADPHLWEFWGRWPMESPGLALFARTLENIAGDQADFHFDLGDIGGAAFARTAAIADERYAVQRRFLDRALRATPFFQVLGNHEGELGWLTAAGDSVPVWAERARRLLIPNPYPDAFYKGCADSAASGPGFRESYYAWEWGDALFIVLDPYWNTLDKPHHNDAFGKGGGWAWTLGREQYEWLFTVLRRSERKWKIVLTHQLVGGVDYGADNYGRGGIEVSKFAVDFRPSYEWGGQNRFGEDVFFYFRPDWTHGPIHDLLVYAGVNLVIHGHDHFCALQKLDGITYALCPQPADVAYTYGALAYGAYSHGVILPNSGHLRFRVSPADILIDYVRAYLPGDGNNGEVAATWSVAGGFCTIAPLSPQLSPAGRLVIAPNPAPGGGVIEFQASAAPGGALRGAEKSAELRVFDTTGRLCASPGRLREGRLAWDLRGSDGPMPSGIYYCIAGDEGERESTRLVIVR